MSPTIVKKQNNQKPSLRNGLIIDTLAMAQRLRAVGVPEEQANEQIEIIAEVFEHNMSTKEDVANIRKDIEQIRASSKEDIALIRRDMELIRAELKQDITLVKKAVELIRVELQKDIETLRGEMYQMKSQIIIWVAGLLLAQGGLIVTLQKLL